MQFLLQFSFKGHHFVVLPLQSAVLLPVVLQLLVDLPYLGVGLLLVQLLSYRCKRQTSKLVVMEVPPLHPGPASLELLLLQAEHRSSYIWEGQLLTQMFRAKRVDDMWDFLRVHHLHPRIVRRLQDTGFYRIVEIGRLQLDWSLITALIER
uniref:Serine/threonine-protein phosphatase 7 long form homolog isoform X2 n=1 Tax=Nicotiana tabacum TaxID=4097 RepID=A0A1S4BJH8_TOBAC|nr:PREDICTED: serine/threonine-protein phosphatase 7 long form homolog isoform X2 [Nicotiana tabacum]